MMKDNFCTRCGAGTVLAGVELTDKGRPLRVRVVEPDPPDRPFIWSPGEAVGTVRAWICAACGYTELYTDNLSALYDYYRKGLSPGG